MPVLGLGTKLGIEFGTELGIELGIAAIEGGDDLDSRYYCKP